MTHPDGREVVAGVAEHAACFSMVRGRRLVESPDGWGTYMVHIPIEAENLSAAVELARMLSVPLAMVDAARVPEAVVSHRGNQFYLWPLFCNRSTANDGRCLFPAQPPADCDGASWHLS